MQIRIDLKIFVFVIIFLIMKNIEIYAFLMLFALIHEIGHLLCGLVLGFKPKSLNIMPYGFKLNFKINCNDYNKKIKKGNMLSVKKIIVALAGPLTNLICILTIVLLEKNFAQNNIYKYEYIIYANILIAIFNLLPIYPLDGGKILQETLHIFIGLRKSYLVTQNATWIMVAILTAFTSILILIYKNIILLFAISYLWSLAYRTEKEFDFKEKIYKNIEKYTKNEGKHNLNYCKNFEKVL